MIPTGSSLQADTSDLIDSEMPSLTYRFDFENGRIIGKVDGTEAIRQAIQKILSTERYEHLIYSFNYGFEQEGLVGSDASFVRSELKRRIQEALLQDDRIMSLENFDITTDGEAATVSFVVVSTFGEISMESEVSRDGGSFV
jgi:phage baseplate assembly protein W